MCLINEIQAKGLCHRCGEDIANAISLTEAKEIMELVKRRCKEAVNNIDSIGNNRGGNIFKNDAIKAIEGV